MTLGFQSARTCLALAVGSALALLTGCSAAAPAAHPEPTAPEQCNDLATHRGDGFVLIGTDWSGEPHQYGDAATVYACVLPITGGEVQLIAAGTGERVHPARQRVSGSPMA